jgi:hypothetical protein
MNDLSLKELQEKIDKVTKDIEGLRSTGDSSRKLEVLTEYKKYLEDELRFLKNEKNGRHL